MSWIRFIDEPPNSAATCHGYTEKGWYFFITGNNMFDGPFPSWNHAKLAQVQKLKEIEIYSNVQRIEDWIKYGV